MLETDGSSSHALNASLPRYTYDLKVSEVWLKDRQKLVSAYAAVLETNGKVEAGNLLHQLGGWPTALVEEFAQKLRIPLVEKEPQKIDGNHTEMLQKYSPDQIQLVRNLMIDQGYASSDTNATTKSTSEKKCPQYAEAIEALALKQNGRGDGYMVKENVHDFFPYGEGPTHVERFVTWGIAEIDHIDPKNPASATENGKDCVRLTPGGFQIRDIMKHYAVRGELPPDVPLDPPDVRVESAALELSALKHPDCILNAIQSLLQDPMCVLDTVELKRILGGSEVEKADVRRTLERMRVYRTMTLKQWKETDPGPAKEVEERFPRVGGNRMILEKLPAEEGGIALEVFEHLNRILEQTQHVGSFKQSENKWNQMVEKLVQKLVEGTCKPALSIKQTIRDHGYALRSRLRDRPDDEMLAVVESELRSVCQSLGGPPEGPYVIKGESNPRRKSTKKKVAMKKEEEVKGRGKSPWDESSSTKKKTTRKKRKAKKKVKD